MNIRIFVRFDEYALTLELYDWLEIVNVYRQSHLTNGIMWGVYHKLTCMNTCYNINITPHL